ncbi:MAG: hypothetical protein CL847_02865 [Crocinitomicaceae bacterium]|nr:hypothetical protein [Crocinitomicaceae bacterium]|tara:strand:- start:2826 stop:3605 length:780 start_codon:yes stop_codon:yes gene_type:complete
MTPKEKEDWEKTTEAKLFISDNYYHHHAYEIIHTHKNLKQDLTSCLNSKISVTPRIKKTGKKESRGIKADGLNKEIRNLLENKLKAEVKLEVNEERGVFYFSNEKSTIGGFDFAILDHEQNLNSLRNICFGELQYYQGQERWSKFLKKNPDLVKIAKSIKQNGTLGVDFKKSKQKDSPLIVGEIQFGNWALAYRDFFKVLKANVQNSIDCLIYIVPTGDLEIMLSDGIVTYTKTVKIIEDFLKVISVPVWVIGIDIENS